MPIEYCRASLLVILLVAGVGVRAEAVSTSSRPLRQISVDDDPRIFKTEAEFERRLAELDAKTPRSYQLPTHPWADFQWRLDSGLVASRYSDPKFLGLTRWQERNDYIESHSAIRMLEEPNAKERAALISRLSPAEKYDLLLGDGNFSLSRAQWLAGAELARADSLRSWMGICEGSVAAGVMMEEPLHPVTLQTPQGDPLTFEIQDIKGLGSLLWSTYDHKFPISGQRCRQDNPLKDNHGVVVNEDCFNSNPATWHLTLLNRLGFRQQTFFINRASRPLEVWNSSVLGYQINYFNVATGEYKQDLVDAQVLMEEAVKGKDMKKFKVFRSPFAVSVVGVDMTITVATQMLHLEPTMMFNYRYDLELDTAGVVIGGEWHVDSHPRFIWLIDKPDFKPANPDDPFAKQGWNGEPLSPQSLSLLRSVSEKNRVLPSVIYGLFEMSRR